MSGTNWLLDGTIKCSDRFITLIKFINFNFGANLYGENFHCIEFLNGCQQHIINIILVMVVDHMQCHTSTYNIYREKI